MRFVRELNVGSVNVWEVPGYQLEVTRSAASGLGHRREGRGAGSAARRSPTSRPTRSPGSLMAPRPCLQTRRCLPDDRSRAMIALLNLLAAIALLVWGTHRAHRHPARLRRGTCAASARRACATASSPLPQASVTSLVRSSTATCLIVASFVGHGLIATAPALAVMLSADIGTALMTVVFSFGSVLALAAADLRRRRRLRLAREHDRRAPQEQVAIGLRADRLALQLIVAAATRPLTASPARAGTARPPNEGDAPDRRRRSADRAVVTRGSRSCSWSRRWLPGRWCRCQSGSGWCSAPTSAAAFAHGAPRRKCAACRPATSLVQARRLRGRDPRWSRRRRPGLDLGLTPHAQPSASTCSSTSRWRWSSSGLTTPVRWPWSCSPTEAPVPTERPNHLDPTALDTPSLAISCAAREALHQADVVETMLRGMLTVIRSNDLAVGAIARARRQWLTGLYRPSRPIDANLARRAVRARGPALDRPSSFTINMEQISDIIEACSGVERTIRRNLAFSSWHGRGLPPARATARQPACLGRACLLDGHDARRWRLSQKESSATSSTRTRLRTSRGCRL